jgi:transmembrane sensor
LMGLIQQPGFERILDKVIHEEFSEVQDEWHAISYQEVGAPVRKPLNWGRWIEVAAMFLMVLSVIGYFYYSSETKPETLVFSTGYGETRKVLLPDSSEVMLNANSKVAWNKDWKAQKKRFVQMEGEAFFKVKKQEDMQFVVEAGDVNVYVLGTVFNVSNRRGVTNVFLESGKVDLALEGSENKTVTMAPGNAVKYEKIGSGLSIEELSTLEQNASWVTGMLQFQDKSFSEVLMELEELYGKNFQVVDDNLLKRRMDLSLPYGNWMLISNAIGLAMNVELIENENNVIIK